MGQKRELFWKKERTWRELKRLGHKVIRIFDNSKERTEAQILSFYDKNMDHLPLTDEKKEGDIHEEKM
ncbi:MAG: hypothetical protein EOM03_05145 [Clostridia bacterium]|nr:hypothetical protein [Clostridia bacterium]